LGEIVAGFQRICSAGNTGPGTRNGPTAPMTTRALWPVAPPTGASAPGSRRTAGSPPPSHTSSLSPTPSTQCPGGPLKR
jgi:hypothetical protein